MTEVTLHPKPRWRDVVLEQIRIVGLRLRGGALAAAVLFVIPIVIKMVGGGGPGSDSNETFVTPLVSFLLSFTVWSGEKRFGPAFLWTLPVDRRRMALARVFAGWVWMMVGLAFFGSYLLAMALLTDVSPIHAVMRVPLIWTIAAYLLGSALVLGLRHPLRWLFGIAGLFFLGMTLTDQMGRPGNGEWPIVAGSSMLRWAVYGPYGVRTLLGLSGFFSTVQDAGAGGRTLPDLTEWAAAAFLWIGAGLAALWAAASRHGERRRQ